MSIIHLIIAITVAYVLFNRAAAKPATHLDTVARSADLHEQIVAKAEADHYSFAAKHTASFEYQAPVKAANYQPLRAYWPAGVPQPESWNTMDGVKS